MSLVVFQSTRPARGATAAGLNPVLSAIFQSTRPARGATQEMLSNTAHQRISIHAPREGRDNTHIAIDKPLINFNPRAPRGARLLVRGQVIPVPQFQSTRPARGATCVLTGSKSTPLISIHAPREGRDKNWDGKLEYTNDFNPRAPRGARLRVVKS